MLQDETVDVVDEDDNVVGQESKSRCHREGILHRSAAVFVFKDGSMRELLVQRRSIKKGIKPGKLCLPGGHLGAGESYRDAARREFEEEMLGGGRHEGEMEELFKIRKSADEDPEFHTAYRTVHPGPFSLDGDEADDWRFEPIEDLMERVRFRPDDYTETFRVTLEEYARRLLG